MIETDILFAPVQELVRLLKRGTITPVRLTEAYLQRIGKHDGRLHATVTTLEDRALGEARQAERELRAGLRGLRSMASRTWQKTSSQPPARRRRGEPAHSGNRPSTGMQQPSADSMTPVPSSWASRR